MFYNSLSCKICGGEVTADESGSTCSCISCGAESMFPKGDIKKINRMNYLRNEFDFIGAKRIADDVSADQPSDSEGYWNRLLCEYGIQFVRTGGKRVPVCRIDPTQLPEVPESPDCKHTLYYSVEEVQSAYSSMAARLEECVDVARGVFAQPPKYDIFLLTSEELSPDSDPEGSRLFLRFVENLGFSVFYMPETLKDMDEAEKAARIACAADNSTIMLACFRSLSDCRSGLMNYVVKRFLEKAENNTEKKIFPVFNSHMLLFQQLPESLVWCDEAFDSSDDDFMREISDTVEKILKPEAAAIVPDSIVTVTAANKENLIKRAYMFLEDGEFETADTYFDKILDIDIEDSRAYFGKLLAERRLTSEEQIMEHQHPLTGDKNYVKALRFATPEQKAHYESLNNKIVDFIEGEKKRISEQRERLNAEREEKEAIERQRRERQMREERKSEFQRRRDPLRKTLAEINAELNKTLIMPAKRKELEEQKKTVEKNIKELEAQFPDIWD